MTEQNVLDALARLEREWQAIWDELKVMVEKDPEETFAALDRITDIAAEEVPKLVQRINERREELEKSEG